MHLTLSAAVWLLVGLQCVLGIQFYLSSGAKWCFTEDVEAGAQVHGRYFVVAGEGAMPVDLTVRSEDGQIVFVKRDAQQGGFQFKTPERSAPVDPDADGSDTEQETDEELRYEVCVQNDGVRRQDVRRRVMIQFLQGHTARDYNELAKKEHLDELLTKLQYMLDVLSNLKRSFVSMTYRENNTRRINELTQKRVILASASSVAALVFFSFYQMYYTRRQLKRIKAI